MLTGVKVGDLVWWEEWAGVQRVTRLYYVTEEPGGLLFADLEPAGPESKQVGHGVHADMLDIEEDGVE